MTKSAASRKTSARASWRIPLAFSLAALACGVLLGGVSAWLLGSVAIAGLTSAALMFNFHIPAALIRLFALGRTAARYGERLTGHKAALDDQVVHRAALFGAMASAASVRRASWQFGDQDRLSDYLDDVEDLDYARLRFDLPLLSAASAFAAGLVVTAIVAPVACLLILVAVAILLTVGAGTSREGALT
jgi:ATP-binding cassette subfamily C protein CydC